MKKTLLLLTVLCGMAVSTFAQSGGAGKFSIGVEAGLPLGDFKTFSDYVIGGSLKYDHPVAASTFVTLSAGYNSFHAKEGFGSFGFVPVKAGLKYFLNEGFYAEGQLGASFSTESGGGTAFAYAPGIGYAFGGGLDAGIRYEAWSNDGTISQLGLRVAYSF